MGHKCQKSLYFNTMHLAAYKELLKHNGLTEDYFNNNILYYCNIKITAPSKKRSIERKIINSGATWWAWD